MTKRAWLLLSCALMACGDARDLSLGEARCEGVPCNFDRIVGQEIERVDRRLEHIEHEQPLAPSLGESACTAGSALDELAGVPDGGTSCMQNAMIAVGEEELVVATQLITPIGDDRLESVIRLAGFAGDQLRWENVELRREIENVSNYFGESFAIAARGTPGEAILGVTLETGDYSVYGQRFYVVDAEGELTELFEDQSAGRIHAIAPLGEGLVVLSEYELHFELTRYDAQGEIEWRQTELALSGGALEQTLVIGTAGVHVIDDERIVVLVPEQSSCDVMELTADGEPVRMWLSITFANAESFVRARLAEGPEGQVVIGMDGYDVRRATLRGGDAVMEQFIKDRTQYYTPAVLGLHVDRHGYLYIATIEGIRDEGYGLLERISPDLSLREAFVLRDMQTPDGDLLYLLEGELHVTEDQRTLYFSRGGAVGKLELPPLGEPSSGE